MQNFIDVHRNLVLRDALKDLESCEIGNLSKLLHRLKGTLGTFQFPEVSQNLRELYGAIEKENNQKLLLEKKQAAIELIKHELEIEV